MGRHEGFNLIALDRSTGWCIRVRKNHGTTLRRDVFQIKGEVSAKGDGLKTHVIEPAIGGIKAVGDIGKAEGPGVAWAFI